MKFFEFFVKFFKDRYFAFFSEIGGLFLFCGHYFKSAFIQPIFIRNVFSQLYFIANLGMPIIVLMGLFIGMIFALQMFVALSMLSINSMIGAAITLALCRELAPVITGLLVAGRAGSAMAAELGTMRVTEQIDALDVMGIDSFNYLIVPRITAAIFALPILSAINNFTANLGAWLIATKVFSVDNSEYFAQVGNLVTIKDLMQGLIKSFFFGFVVAIIGTYFGHNVKNGAAGVGQATNKAVVWGMVAIIITDYILTSILLLII